MSHFGVLVIGENVDDQLAPFHEFECTGVDDEHVVDVDETAEVLQEYAERDKSDGKGLLEWACDWHGMKATTAANLDLEGEHKYGYILLDDAGEPVKFVRRTNPNKKWNWYQVGGRWTGFFKVKEGAEADVGTPGLMTPRAEAGHGDSLLKRDVDMEGMRADAVARALAMFDHFEPAFRGHPIPVFAEFRARFPDSIDAAREAYHADPVSVALKALEDKEHRLPFMTTPSELFCGGDRDAVIRKARAEALLTHAILKDGQWVERGEMGWFACVHDEKDLAAWEQEFSAMLDALPDDARLTIVDCHI